ncbi:3-isopropylmalate dehydratase [Oleispirillum naphthae]|uniref:LeuD/DmdB family oxidoreductase small subunit n=1 Tax=Oleispirillum naphthae TaxID=2838853 RepID=UPI0030822CEE
MSDPAAGKAWVFGDDVNTDYIISSKRKRDTLDPVKLAAFLMEDIRPGFGGMVSPGDFLVGGRNFGCGSAMEIATDVIRGAGIRAVLAKSFSRTFFRNGINGGLLMIAVDTDGIAEGDPLAVEERGGATGVRNLRTGRDYAGAGVSPLLDEIARAGGLIAYLRLNRGFGLTPDGRAGKD